MYTTMSNRIPRHLSCRGIVRILCSVWLVLIAQLFPIELMTSFTPSLAFQKKSTRCNPSLLSSSSQYINPFKNVKHLLHNTTISSSKEENISQELLLKIVQWGQTYFASSTTANNYNNGKQIHQSPMMRVPGCIATVHVSTTLIPISHDDNNINTYSPDQYFVRVDGTADALISKGLVALVAAAFSQASRPTAQQILEIRPSTVADDLGLRSTLSRGRNDGLASIVTIVQQQIRSILLKSNNVSSDDNTVISSPRATVSNNDDDHQKIKGKKKTKVAMLLSGGVDSSVALSLLSKDPNYEVHAFYLKIWLEDELQHLGVCPWEEDWKICQSVVAHLSLTSSTAISLEAMSFQHQYHEHIINYTLSEARRGRTPNPDIMCNSRVKFGAFVSEIMQRQSFDYIATGHYARVQHFNDNNASKLYRAPDGIKDQSYFLSTLSQEQLKRVLFPIGHLEKKQVRALAEAFNLPNKNRPDSQGLCFLGKVKFDNFLQAYLGEKPGNVIDVLTRDVIGQHKGLWFHTVGQRKGIGKCLDPKVTTRGPWYIVAKDPIDNLIFASNDFDNSALLGSSRSNFFVEDIRWISGHYPHEQLVLQENNKTWIGRFEMKIRHGPTISRGSLSMNAVQTGDTVTICSSSEGRIELDDKDGGLAPGQFVVFYQLGCDECLGSGVISEKHWAQFLFPAVQQ